jgi:hypothetical protein
VPNLPGAPPRVTHLKAQIEHRITKQHARNHQVSDRQFAPLMEADRWNRSDSPDGRIVLVGAEFAASATKGDG